MKLLPLIIAIYTGLLTVQPTLTQVYSVLTQPTEVCSTKKCCKHESPGNKQLPGKQNPGDCCSNGICNPFEQCACCSGLTAVCPMYMFIATLVAELTVPISADINSNYFADCFHPPKVV